MGPMTSAGVEEYLAGLFAERNPILREMEQIAAEREFPIVGPLVGGLLQVLSRTANARRILELGSGFGYSAFWFAGAISDPGEIVLTDVSAENLEEAERFLARGRFPHRFERYRGDALDRLRREGDPWDVIFCDIDKHAYPDAIEPAVERLRPGGLLIFDNMLWSGRVFESAGPGDRATEGVRAAGRKLAAHPALWTTLIPLRDGVSVSVRT
ncbi:MAG: methyltransferase domain-containing protein [Candidatus Eisenbacteria bacterium]|nr:methyltransferase domain-containing protein [Candidatus Latescibacterota bacterium]MBD3302402.1 methyltransferase domain-containing protein [Candidatus Eisenbacteria bacterium]